MRKHLRGNRGTRWLAILLTAAMVVGSVDTTVLAEAAKGAEEQTLPVAEAGTSVDAKDKEETPVVKTETSEEVKNPEAAENAQPGKNANVPETSGNAEEAGAVAESTSENGAGGQGPEQRPVQHLHISQIRQLQDAEEELSGQHGLPPVPP